MAEPLAILWRGVTDDAPHPRGPRTHPQGTRRSGQWVRIPMDDIHAPQPSLDVDLLDLDDALTELGAFDLRISQVAELRFFGGLTLAGVRRCARHFHRHRGAGVADGPCAAVRPLDEGPSR